MTTPPPQKLQLIVHADDLGLADHINRGIIDAYKHGILTSTSIVACGAAYDDAVLMLKAHPGLDLGVHLTLTQESPLLAPFRVRSLLGDDGRFLPTPQALLRRYLRGRVRLSDIHEEFTAQIRRARASGLRVTHLDSHQHVHMLPGVFQIARDLAQRFSIPAIRLLREPLRLAPTKRNLELLVLRRLSRSASRHLQPLRSADHTAGFRVAGRLTAASLLKIIDKLPARGVVELICHPGRKAPNSPYAHWGYAWQGELDALSAPAVVESLLRRQIQLVSYREFLPHAEGEQKVTFPSNDPIHWGAVRTDKNTTAEQGPPQVIGPPSSQEEDSCV